MRRVPVRVGGTGYSVHVEAGLLGRAGTLVADLLAPSRVVVVADRRVAGLHGKTLRSGLRRAKLPVARWIEIPPGERSKTLRRAERLFHELVAAGIDRWTPVLILGGGVAGDLGAFVASTYFRGLPVVQIPTTVLAQVDSSVGGKTGINFAGAKNLIGTFHQPRLVLADPEVLATLAERDYRAGLAEAVKIGVTLRPDLLEHMEQYREDLLARDAAALEPVVAASVEAKGDVVERDEREQDVRAVLNYGHTIGHALEATALGRIRHGEAVAVGMNAAAWVGEALGVTDPGVRPRQNELLAGLGLKLTRPGADHREISRKLRLDKKVRNRLNRFVLTLRIGGASVWPHIPGKLLRDAVRLVAS